MAHDVFISHSSRDKPVSDAVCAALENAGIRCWVAPRDVQPGRSFAGEITRAIQQSKAMVLIFSANSNTSSQVLREVQLAVDSQLHILQFRIEDVLLNDDLKYYLSTPHWLDAMTPPLESHLGRLARSLTTLLGKPEIEARSTVQTEKSFPPVPSAPLVPESPAGSFPVRSVIAGLVFAGIVLGFFLRPNQRSTREPGAQIPATPTAARTPLASPSEAVIKINFSELTPGFLEADAFLSRGVRTLRTFGGKPAINDADPGMVLPRGYTRVLNVRGEHSQTTLVFEFEPAIKHFSVTRIGGNPTSLPTWTLEAYDSGGRIVDTLTQMRGDTTEPRIRTPATFSVRGSTISSVALAVDNRHGAGTWATYNCLPIIEIEFQR
jgi:hypothetical protein